MGDATEGKILRNALEEGDAWFNTGDLMKTIDVGFNLGYDHYQFVDRIGDTFRWKSENVSTNEVGEIINGFDQIQFCNVYGVEIPKTDGKAGMVALGTDFPVEQVNPFLTFYAAVARQDVEQYPEGGFQMENALSREEDTSGRSERWFRQSGTLLG